MNKPPVNGTPITIDRERVLSYTYEDWLELKRRFGAGKTKFDLLGLLSASDDETIILCLWIGLRHEDKKLRDGDDIVPLIKEYLYGPEAGPERNISDFVKPLITALKVAKVFHKTIDDLAAEAREATAPTGP